MNYFRKYLAVLVLSFVVVGLTVSQTNYPGEKWEYAEKPEDLGFSSLALEKAEKYSGTINTAALVIIHKGKIVDEWGKVDKKYMTHSTRKSFLSAMYGNYVRQGVIDLDKSLLELGFDDEPPLSDVENKATLRDCIKARSGIYHTALYESAGMKALKPERHTQIPGEFWYYNNWDFNVLGTVFEKLTGKKIFEALENEIAKPIGMEDFTAADGEYVTGWESVHAAYPFIITAHDMGRFGLLMLSKGMWDGKQIIPADWVEESTAYYSDAALYGSDGYGYMWWVSHKGNKFPHLLNVEVPGGTYSARGAGGHYIMIIPEYDLVVIHRVDTFKRANSVSGGEFGKLLKLILDARVE